MIKYTDNAINIIACKNFKGIGRAWIVKNLKGNEDIENIVSLINNKSKQNQEVTVDYFEAIKNQIVSQIEKLGDSCDGVVAIGDKNFPSYRGDVKESERPIYLFYKGDLSLLDIENDNITVIGLLNPDETIENRERKIIAEIVKKDVTVVSGLAFGCDSIAHKEALNGGRTIAILPSPLSKIMPAKNKDLAFKIFDEGGLIVTEYYDEHKSFTDLNSRYKDRDRLQALYCDAIVLVASYAQDSAKRWEISDKKLDSGARLAMGFAKNYNIARAVMYNENSDSLNPMFDLNRQLLDEKSDITILTPKTLEDLIKKIKTGSNREIDKPTDLFG